MENLHIEFSVQDLDAGLFFLNFVQKYGRFNSRFFPIFVSSRNEFPPIDYLIIEANEDPLQELREIGKMTFMKLENESKVIIEFIGEGRNRWYTVEKLVQAVLEDLWNKGYRINSIFPRGLLHPIKVGYTKKELIGKKIYIEGELITEEHQSTPGLPEEANQPDLEESASSKPTVYLPKDKEQLKKWRKAYAEIKRLNTFYRNEFSELRIDTPNPSNDDYRDALIRIMGKKVSAKYIQRIRKAGKAGLLK